MIMVNQILGRTPHYGDMRWSHQKPDGPSAAPVFGVVAVFLPLLLFLLADRAGAAEGCRPTMVVTTHVTAHVTPTVCAKPKPHPKTLPPKPRV